MANIDGLIDQVKLQDKKHENQEENNNNDSQNKEINVKNEHNKNVEIIGNEMKKFKPAEENAENDEISENHYSPLMDLERSTAYSTEIYEYWRTLETERQMMDFTKTNWDWRTVQVLQLKNLVKNFHIDNLTLHLSIYILDKFLSLNDVNKGERKKTVIACLLIAAKIELHEKNIPTLAMLNAVMWRGGGDQQNSKLHFTLPEYCFYELRILRALQFKLTVPTVATFARYYSRSTVNMADFEEFQRKKFMKDNGRDNGSNGGGEHSVGSTAASILKFDGLEQMLGFVNNLLFNLIDVSIEIFYLLKVLPSKIAAACIFAARRCLDITPNWPQRLEILTQYKEIDLVLIADDIFALYKAKLLIKA